MLVILSIVFAVISLPCRQISAQLNQIQSESVPFEWTEIGSLPLPKDVVHFNSTKYGPQVPCSNVSSGRALFDALGEETCFIPHEGEAITNNLNWKVLVEKDPLHRHLVWKKSGSAHAIRQFGVNACDHDDCYVCAHPDIGPGKLVILPNKTHTCYVAEGEQHHAYSFPDYLVLMLDVTEPQYELSQVTYDTSRTLQYKTPGRTSLMVTNFINEDDNNHRTMTQIHTIKTTTDEVIETAEIIAGKQGQTRVINIPFGPKITIQQNEGGYMNEGQGISDSVSFEDILEVSIDIKKHCKCNASIDVIEQVMEIPFTAKLHTQWSDGIVKSDWVHGVYKRAVPRYETVIYDLCVQIDDESKKC